MLLRRLGIEAVKTEAHRRVKDLKGGRGRKRLLVKKPVTRRTRKRRVLARLTTVRVQDTKSMLG